MKVILQQEMPSLGKVGDVVRVRDGYGRNFLIPRGLAAIADERNTNRLEHQKRIAAALAARQLAEARALAERLSATAVTIRAKVGDEGKLFGSVTNRDIADALAKDGINIDRKHVELVEPIRVIGAHTVPVKLSKDVSASVKVYVIAG